MKQSMLVISMRITAFFTLLICCMRKIVPSCTRNAKDIRDDTMPMVESDSPICLSSFAKKASATKSVTKRAISESLDMVSHSGAFVAWGVKKVVHNVPPKLTVHYRLSVPLPIPFTEIPHSFLPRLRETAVKKTWDLK